MYGPLYPRPRTVCPDTHRHETKVCIQTQNVTVQFCCDGDKCSVNVALDQLDSYVCKGRLQNQAKRISQ